VAGSRNGVVGIADWRAMALSTSLSALSPTRLVRSTAASHARFEALLVALFVPLGVPSLMLGAA
jgi:hypothetical protein